MATPLVSGLAALMMSSGWNQVNLTAHEAKCKIVDYVTVKSDYLDLVRSGGLIDVARSLQAVKNDSLQGSCTYYICITLHFN